MSGARCVDCGSQWNAAHVPLCNPCEKQRLLAAPNLIARKHDPRLLPLVDDTYRSCLSHEFLDNVEGFVGYATANGSWFYNTTHATWSLFTAEPLGRFPGSGIHAGDRAPDHALDGLMFADALADPHAFAVDQVRVRHQVRNGELVPLSRCSGTCDNLRIPGKDACVLHEVPPRALAVDLYAAQ